MDSTQELIYRKQQAEALVNSPLFQEAFKHLDNLYYDNWLNNSELTREEREEIWRQLKAMQHLKQFFQTVLEQGTQAMQTLNLQHY